MIPLKDNVPTARFPIVTVAIIAICVAVFGWQLSFSGSEELSSQFPGISERTANTMEYGAVPYRLLHPGEDCALGAEQVSPTQAEPAVVCTGSENYTEAVALSEENPNTIPEPLPLDTIPWFLTIVTSMFMHGGFLHIGSNMLFLWIFGNNVEDSMGHGRFLLFYLLGGAAAVYAQSVLDPGSTVPTIGASGAVAAVLGAYLLLLPHARVLALIFLLFFVTVVEVPAYLMLGIWFVLQFLPAVGQAAAPDVAGGGVAYMAHVGGFVFGLALIKLFAQRHPERAPEPEPPYPVY